VVGIYLAFAAINLTDRKGDVHNMLLGHGGPVVVEVSTKLSRRTLTSGTRSGAFKREIEYLEKENIRAKEM
jgi:hypothetical protein